MKKIVQLIMYLFAATMLFANDDIWDNDFYLKNFSDGNGKFDKTAVSDFNNLMLNYGIAASSSFNEPAETLGSKGFEISPVYSYYGMGSGDYWKGTYGATSPGGLHLTTVKFRKGLPASFELGGNFSYIIGSHMFVMGGQLKAAILEGINFLPDVSVRTSFTKLFGAKEVNLNTLSIDFMIGYDFGVGGMIAIAPYFAWSYTKITASSNIIATKTSTNPFECDENNEDCNYDYNKCKGIDNPLTPENEEQTCINSVDASYNNSIGSFPEYKDSLNRFILGVRIHNATFIFTPEVVLTGEDIWGANIKIGIDY